MSSNRKVPTSALNDGKVWTKLNALLGYFTVNNCFISEDKYKNNKMYEWMLFKQYSYEQFIAVAKITIQDLDLCLTEYCDLQPKWHKALATID